MNAFVLSDVLAAALLADMTTAVSGSLVDTTLMLGKTNVPAPNKALGMAQFTEADFTGYAAEAGLVFGTPFLDVDGLWKIKAPSVDFVMTDAVTPNTIYQAILTNAAKTEFRGVITFETPISLNVAGQGVTVVPVFPLPAQSCQIIDE